MRLPFKKNRDAKSNVQEDDFLDAYPEMSDNQQSKKEGTVFRIAIYFGLAIVIVLAVGGYFYIRSHQLSFINCTAKSGPLNPVNSAGSDDPFANIAGDEKKTAGEASPLEALESPVHGKSSIDKTVPVAPSPEKISSPKEKNAASPIQAPSAPAITSAVPAQPDTAQSFSKNHGPLTNQEQAISPVTTPEASTPKRSDAAKTRPETILDELLLKDDNPFREKFLKKFEEAQTAKLPKDGKAKNKNSRNAQPLKPFIPGKPGMNFDEGELGILPGIAGMKDPGNQLRVYGVIRTGNNSIILTNRGELKVGSTIDGDVISSVNMNEIYLKSGRIIKVSGQ